jgi:hypothetical protein
MKFIRFMTSRKGRVARVLMGIGIIVLGQAFVSGSLSTVITIVAFIPIGGGVLDFCLVGVALGYPFSGAKTRMILEEREV